MWRAYSSEPTRCIINTGRSSHDSGPLYHASSNQIHESRLAQASSSNEQPDNTVYGTAEADMLHAMLQNLQALSDSYCASLVVYDTEHHAPVVDLACGDCPVLCVERHRPDAALQRQPAIKKVHTANVTFFAQEHHVGTLCVCCKEGLTGDDIPLFSALENIAAQAFFDRQQFNREHEDDVLDRALDAWVQVLKLNDSETAEHSRHVTTMAVELARACGVSGAELVHIRRGALLHDIGKLGIPNAIWHKPGPLSDEEWRLVRQHPCHASEMLAHIPFLQPALAIPLSYTEHWDGNGYPDGLKGEDIPLAARLFAVVHVWDALRSERPYRKVVWTDKQARAYIKYLAASQFDPAIVRVFLRLLDAMPHIFCAK